MNVNFRQILNLVFLNNDVFIDVISVLKLGLVIDTQKTYSKDCISLRLNARTMFAMPLCLR